MKIPARLVPLLLLPGSLACATRYVTPGGPVRLGGITQADVREAFATAPAAPFPATLALVRVQSPDYRSPSARSSSGARYSILTGRELEDDAHVKQIASLPELRGVTALSRLLLPERMESVGDLRASAARLRADLLLVYTVDTQFHSRTQSTPLTVLTLGAARTKDLLVSSTASAILVDVRSGFVYGAVEDTQRVRRQASAWTSHDAVEAARLATERAAFEALMNHFEPLWMGVVAEHKRAAALSSP